MRSRIRGNGTWFSGLLSLSLASFGLSLGLSLVACGPVGLEDGFKVATQNASLSPAGENVNQTPPPVTPPLPSIQPTPTPAPKSSFVTEATPLWEKARPADGEDWTRDAFSIVNTYGDVLLKGASDITKFCPKYSFLTHNQKLNFWVYLVSAMIKYESNFKPTCRFLEWPLGKDSVTGLPVYSEGLLQLSYQDVKSYAFCNQFDWSKDKLLTVDDARKTIFDPHLNLTCGIRILNAQVKRKGMIAARGYWSVLFPSGTHSNSKVKEISALTKQIPFCQL